ncbi:hypothetical protein ACOMHN_024590 [Nucella lapillus]
MVGDFYMARDFYIVDFYMARDFYIVDFYMARDFYIVDFYMYISSPYTPMAYQHQPLHTGPLLHALAAEDHSSVASDDLTHRHYALNK